MATTFLYDTARSIRTILGPTYQCHVSIHDFTHSDREGHIPDSVNIAVRGTHPEANTSLEAALTDLGLGAKRICRRFVTTKDPIGTCACTTN